MKIPDQRLDPPEPKTVATCPCCAESVYEGEPVVRFDGCVYHKDCFHDCAEAILMDRFSLSVTIA